MYNEFGPSPLSIAQIKCNLLIKLTSITRTMYRPLPWGWYSLPGPLLDITKMSTFRIVLIADENNAQYERKIEFEEIEYTLPNSKNFENEITCNNILTVNTTWRKNNPCTCHEHSQGFSSYFLSYLLFYIRYSHQRLILIAKKYLFTYSACCKIPISCFLGAVKGFHRLFNKCCR